MTLEGKMALITGGGRGIGQGIAEVLGEEGVLVAVNDLHPERAEATVEAVARAGGDAAKETFAYLQTLPGASAGIGPSSPVMS